MRSALLVSLALGCSSATILPEVDPDDFGGSDTGESSVEDPDLAAVYDASRLLEVEVELDPEDWEELRKQERDILEMFAGDSCMQEPWDKPYTWFEATVKLDGEELAEPIAVRKKGLLGSVESGRPSLKLDFDRVVDGQTWEGATRLTLNNGRQDLSRLKTCMGYELYEAMGLPASRCSLAHVTVNGEDLGVYANVEPIKKPLLRRLYDSDEGVLYEGTLSDFREGYTLTFEDKLDNGDPADLQAVIDALAEPRDTRLAALDQVIDLDEFLRYWAAEALLGHWDSYDGNTNNFYMYKDPADGRFRFLPWGIDAILVGEEPFGEGQPVSVVTRSALSAGIYEVTEGRERYFEALHGLMNDAWDEERWSDRLDEYQELAAPAQLYPYGREAHQDVVEAMHEFIEVRRQAIDAEGVAPGPDDTLRQDPCIEPQGTVSVSFETTWGSYGSSPTFSTGSGSWEAEIGDDDLPLAFLGAVVGEYEEGSSIFFMSGAHESGANLGVYLLFDTERFEAAGSQEVGWTPIKAYLLYDGDGDLADWQTWGYIWGELTLDETGTGSGDTVQGSISGTLYGG